MEMTCGPASDYPFTISSFDTEAAGRWQVTIC